MIITKFNHRFVCPACDQEHTRGQAKVRFCTGKLGPFWLPCSKLTKRGYHLHLKCTECKCRWISWLRPKMKKVQPSNHCRTCGDTGFQEFEDRDPEPCLDCELGKKEREYLNQRADYVPPNEEEEKDTILDWKNRAVPEGPFPPIPPMDSSALGGPHEKVSQ